MPDDPVRPALLYIIARSYEEIKNYKLSRKYYQRVMDIESKNSKAYKAAKYRMVYCYLLEEDLNAVFMETDGSVDPYFLMLRGYSYFQKLDWENARATLISAEEKFDDKHYSKLMISLYQAIENVSSVKKHSKSKVFLSGLVFPGGGQFVLKDKKNAQGILASSFLLYGIYNLGTGNDNSGDVRFSNSPGVMVPTHKGINTSFSLSDGILSKNISAKSELVKYTAPPVLIGSLLYISSLFKSFSEVEEKNKSLFRFYVNKNLEATPPKLFMDFEEPSIINNRYN
jgi:tetratricopeptide (TPR) repeat protein